MQDIYSQPSKPPYALDWAFQQMKTVDIYNLENLQSAVNNFKVNFVIKNNILIKVGINDKYVTDMKSYICKNRGYNISNLNSFTTYDILLIFKKLGINIPDTNYKIHYKQICGKNTTNININTMKYRKISIINNDMFIDCLDHLYVSVINIGLFDKSKIYVVDDIQIFDLIITELHININSGLSEQTCINIDNVDKTSSEKSILFSKYNFGNYFLCQESSFFNYGGQNNLLGNDDKIQPSLKKIKSIEMPITINEKDKGIIIADVYYPKIYTYSIVFKKIINLANNDCISIYQNQKCLCTTMLLFDKLKRDEYFKFTNPCLCFVEKNLKKMPRVTIDKKDIYNTLHFTNKSSILLYKYTF